MLYKQNTLQGALLILVSELMFATMGATVKALSTELPNEMIVFMRNAFGLIILSLWFFQSSKHSLKTKILPIHLLRAGFGLSAMYCFFYALAHLPLAEGLLLKMTAPLFMPFIAYFWLREHSPKFALLALPIGFIGVMLVLKPDNEFNWVAIIGVLGGLFAAIAKVTVRRLGQSEPTFRVVFYFTFFATFISSIPMLWAWQTPNAEAWYLLILMGMVGTIGQMLLTRGYAVARTAQIAPFTYFSVIYGAIFGYVFWQEVLDYYFVIGAILIAIAGLIAVRPTTKPNDNSLISNNI